MNKILLLVAAGLIVGGVMKRATKNYFKPSEFGGWYEQLNPDLLAAMNRFRELWGAPVLVSQADGAVGRRLGADNTSQHNIDHWGHVNGVDMFPAGMNTPDDMRRAQRLATQAGFTGIGLYTDTSRPMLHGDVRSNKSVGSPALWSRVAGQYLAINEAYV